MLTDDARDWLRDLVAMPEADAAAEIAARLLGEREAAYRAGAAEMAPTVRDAERASVVALLRREMAGAGPLVRRTLEHVEQAIGANEHRAASGEGA